MKNKVMVEFANMLISGDIKEPSTSPYSWKYQRGSLPKSYHHKKSDNGGFFTPQTERIVLSNYTNKLMLEDV